MSKLSVAIITLNEESNIAECIHSVLPIADEVVVLDSFSTDRTAEIVAQHGAKVFQEKFAGFTNQKNRATELCTNEYVLSIDADERLSRELQESILEEKQVGFSAQAYSMNRLNFYCGKPIKTCGWYPDTKIRIWQKTKAHWHGGQVHEQMQVSSDAKVKLLKGDMWHYTYPTKLEMILQIERLSRLAATDLQGQSTVYLFFKMCISPVVRLVRNYIFKLGFTSGKSGWEICYHQSREVYLRYKHALNLKNKRQ